MLRRKIEALWLALSDNFEALWIVVWSHMTTLNQSESCYFFVAIIYAEIFTTGIGSRMEGLIFCHVHNHVLVSFSLSSRCAKMTSRSLGSSEEAVTNVAGVEILAPVAVLAFIFLSSTVYLGCKLYNMTHAQNNGNNGDDPTHAGDPTGEPLMTTPPVWCFT